VSGCVAGGAEFNWLDLADKLGRTHTTMRSRADFQFLEETRGFPTGFASSSLTSMVGRPTRLRRPVQHSSTYLHEVNMSGMESNPRDEAVIKSN